MAGGRHDQTPSAGFLFSAPRFPPLATPATRRNWDRRVLGSPYPPPITRVEKVVFLELDQTLHHIFSGQGPGGPGLTNHFFFLIGCFDQTVVFRSCGTQGSHCGGFSCAAWAPGPPGFSSCDAWAQLLHGTWSFFSLIGYQTPVCCTGGRVL